jgi:hypothetical protein
MVTVVWWWQWWMVTVVWLVTVVTVEWWWHEQGWQEWQGWQWLTVVTSGDGGGDKWCSGGDRWWRVVTVFYCGGGDQLLSSPICMPIYQNQFWCQINSIGLHMVFLLFLFLGGRHKFSRPISYVAFFNYNTLKLKGAKLIWISRHWASLAVFRHVF